MLGMGTSNTKAIRFILRIPWWIFERFQHVKQLRSSPALSPYTFSSCAVFVFLHSTWTNVIKLLYKWKSLIKLWVMSGCFFGGGPLSEGTSHSHNREQLLLTGDVIALPRLYWTSFHLFCWMCLNLLTVVFECFYYLCSYCRLHWLLENCFTDIEWERTGATHVSLEVMQHRQLLWHVQVSTKARGKYLISEKPLISELYEFLKF